MKLSRTPQRQPLHSLPVRSNPAYKKCVHLKLPTDKYGNMGLNSWKAGGYNDYKLVEVVHGLSLVCNKYSDRLL